MPGPLPTKWDEKSYAFFSHRQRPRPPCSSCTPPPNVDCRHPDDNIIVDPPQFPVQVDGRCFLRSTPTFFRPRVGHSQAPKTGGLLDNGANLCLANHAFILRYIPTVSIHDEFVTGVDGIGTARTIGYVHIPIYVDCMSRVGGKTGKVELNLEVHLVDDLPVDLIVGMDAICAYGIDTIVSRSIATLSVGNHIGAQLAFPIEFRRSRGLRDPSSCDSFSVHLQKRIFGFRPHFAGFCWILLDFVDFVDFVDFKPEIQTEGFTASRMAAVDLQPGNETSLGFAARQRNFARICSHAK